MIESTFKSGNYNDWDNLVSEIIPAKNITFRQEIIPLIDSVLISMLGQTAVIEKTKVDASQICDVRKGLQGISYKLIYTIDDFKNSNAPQKAVENDTEAIKNALFREDFHLKNVKININDGTLYIEYETYLEG